MLWLTKEEEVGLENVRRWWRKLELIKVRTLVMEKKVVFGLVE